MKICYISNSAAPSRNASSLQTAKLCECLSTLGHEVKLILPNTGFKYNYFSFYKIKKKFVLKRVKIFKSFPIGIHYYLYSLISIFYSDFTNNDLYITRNFFTSFILSILRKKHIVEIHDDISIEGRIIKFFIRRFKILNSKHIVKVVTTTNSLKKRYVSKYKVKSEKVQVLHNASSLLSKFKYSKKLSKKLNIGYFGSIYKSRGVNFIIHLSNLDKKNKYYIFGGSKEEIELLKKKHKNKNLTLSPYIPFSKVEKKLAKIDVCLLPYTTKVTVSGNVGDISKYTSPLKIFDYMITGKLILCSNLKVIREILKNNENSLLINRYNDPKYWLKKINSISRNYQKYDGIRLKSFKYANKHNLIWRTKKLLFF